VKICGKKLKLRKDGAAQSLNSHLMHRHPQLSKEEQKRRDYWKWRKAQNIFGFLGSNMKYTDE